jgi:hypothetical protein
MKQLDAILNTLARLLEPLIDYINSWVNIVVSLNANPVFKEDNKGEWHSEDGSAVVIVINNGRQPLKVEEVGVILRNGQKLVFPFILDDAEKLPRMIKGKDHAYFRIKRDVLLQMGWAGLESIKYVYLMDATFREYKSRVPKTHKIQIAASLQNRIMIK